MYIIKRTKKRGKQRYCYSVRRADNNKIFSKCTTKKKAQRQCALLYAIKYNKKFKKNIPLQQEPQPEPDPEPEPELEQHRNVN